ncbi:MAG TPA: superoxide dismutase family protein [Bacillus bacterium]|uniref:Superoxide dismutase-like protein YojM n=1 Tax=Siminovitchia fordii TaxID=254759 RepID=A0ABQ4K4M1_9BACI|nr:superoxide dismutase family protein [Siminovitchia fordii]GIN20677.1 superoxide dismutase-like protein YojM [Siminovitchia fordii]HBZ08686.1 superoxide dismutase family protein [Bacillus sp. (in: firmicutes)]
MLKKIMGPMILLLLIISACSGNKDTAEQEKREDTAMVNAETPINIPLINTEGEKVGEAELSENSKGVAIHVRAEGLEPGKRAIHIHETGKCEPPDFKSAGGHFNPGHKEHGFHNPKGYHAGDMPNLEVNSEGKVDEIIKTADVTLERGKPNSLLDKDGSALVVHAGEDDYVTDPAGNAGDRIICGAIVKEGN